MVSELALRVAIVHTPPEVLDVIRLGWECGDTQVHHCCRVERVNVNVMDIALRFESKHLGDPSIVRLSLDLVDVHGQVTVELVESEVFGCEYILCNL